MDDGVVVGFDAEKGYGFLRSASHPADVFVHASAVEGRSPLRPGQRVRFAAEPGPKGLRATRVVPGRKGLAPGALGATLLVAGPLLLAAGLVGLGLGPAAAWLAAINPATALAFAWDKHRATREGRRVPERILLALALAGGSPAAALAMLAFRHKTRKRPFLLAFAGVVLLQVAALAAWLARR